MSPGSDPGVEAITDQLEDCIQTAVAHRYALRIRLLALRIAVRKCGIRLAPPRRGSGAGLPALTLMALPVQAPFLLLALGFATHSRHPEPVSEPEVEAVPAVAAVAAVEAPDPPTATPEPAPVVAPDPSCAAGRSCNPIDAVLPSLILGSTRDGPDHAIERYGCAPDLVESGPEVWYRLALDGPEHLSASLADDTDGVDVDLQLLRSPDPATCVARADRDLEVDLPAGTWFLVLDSWGSDGTRAPGPYRLNLQSSPPR